MSFMTKKDCLDLLMLVSAMESWSFASDTRMPDYLYEKIEDAIRVLRVEILREEEE